MIRSIALLTILGLATVAAAADEFKFKIEKTDPPKELSEAVRAILEPDAILLQDGKGELFATLWLRKTLPSKAAAEQVKSGITYREIPESTVIGAVQFPQAWTDFRKQKVGAGAYTLRLGFQPMNGDHQGTAPYNEFCLLCPANKDTRPDTIEPKELHELSAQVPGGSHPAVLLLFPNSKPENEPKLLAKPNNIWVLNVKRAVDANGTKTSLGFGFTVWGVTTQE